MFRHAGHPAQWPSALFLLALLAAAPTPAQESPPCTIETIAGSDVVLGEGMPATEAELFLPNDARRAPDSSLWISEYGQHVIRRIGPDGMLRTVVGTGIKGFSGDGGPALAAQISKPTGMVFAPDGTLYFGDSGNERIRRVSPDGIIDTVVGNAEGEFGGEDVPALSTRARGFVGLAFSREGELVFSASDDHRVRRLTSDGRVVTIAGTTRPGSSIGGNRGDGGPAIEAELYYPWDIAIAEDGTIFVASSSGPIRGITPDGVINSVLGGGHDTPDGTPVSEAATEQARRVEIDPEGRLYWRSSDAIRRLSSGGLVETVTEVNDRGGYFSLDSDGAPLIIENHSVSRWNGSERVMLAGLGVGSGQGDGGPATAARLFEPHALAAGPDGEIYIVDYGVPRVRVVGTDGIIRNVAGMGARRNSGLLEGPATETPLFSPLDIAADGDGNIYIAGSVGLLARVDPSGALTTVIPSSVQCSYFVEACGDGLPAIEAQTPSIHQIAADSAGNVYVLHERQDSRFPPDWIRRIAPDGTIETLPRNPPGPSGKVVGIAVGAEGHLVVGMDANGPGRFWRYDLETGWSAIELAVGYLGPSETLADAEGDLFVVQLRTQVQRLTADGSVLAVAGSVFGGFSGGFSGDGGPATEGLLSLPEDVVLDRDGNLYIADTQNGRVRRVNRVLECDTPSVPTLSGGARNAAKYTNELAPGTIFSLFGRQLGPDELVSAQLEGDRFPTELAGVRVLINGIPAPLIFVSRTQLGAIVPYGLEVEQQWSYLGQRFISSSTYVLEVESNGLRAAPQWLPVSEAAPGIFSLDSSGSGQGAVLNQDGALNGALNPAAPGSVIVFYATGEGFTDPAGEDGKVAGTVLPKPILPVKVKIGDIEAEVLYAGAAPGLTAGVMQVNARIPEDLTQRGAVDLELIVGDRSSRTNLYTNDVVVIVGE